MDNPPSQKKGIGALGWLGIGCGGVVLIGIIASILVAVFAGPSLKKFAEGAVKNPTRAPADMVVKMGLAEMVAEDDVKKIYTIKQKADGKLVTFYWSKKKNNVGQVQGDASAIPPGDLGVPPTIDLSTPVPATAPDK